MWKRFVVYVAAISFLVDPSVTAGLAAIQTENRVSSLQRPSSAFNSQALAERLVAETRASAEAPRIAMVHDAASFGSRSRPRYIQHRLLGFLWVLAGAMASAQDVGIYEYPTCTSAYCNATLADIPQILAKLPDFAIVRLIMGYSVDQNEWTLKGFQLQVPGSGDPVYSINTDNAKPIPDVSATRFQPSYENLYKQVTVGTLKTLLGDLQQLASFPRYHVPTPMEIDPAALPVATPQNPLGYGLWEAYSCIFELPMAMQRDGDGTVSRIFYFPLHAGVLSDLHMAQSKEEQGIAAQFAALLQNTTVNWPVDLLFGHINLLDGRRAGGATVRSTSRDREGRLRLGVAVVIDTIALARINAQSPAVAQEDKDGLLDHESQHIPQVWGLPQEVQRTTDKIIEAFSKEGRLSVLRDRLELQVAVARTAGYELSAMDHQTVKLPQDTVHVLNSDQEFRDESEKRIRTAEAEILKMFFKDLTPEREKELTAQLDVLLREEYPAAKPPQPQAVAPRTPPVMLAAA